MARLGVIGAGFISQVVHLHAVRMIKADAAALCDPRTALADAVAAEFSIAKTCRTPAELLSDPSIDSVLICVHRRALAPLALQALEAGKAVLSEKPMAATLDQARRLVAAARVPYAIGFMKRHDAGVRLFRAELENILAAGGFGRITHVFMRDFCPTYGVQIPPHIRTNEKPSYRYEEWARVPDALPAAWQDDYDFCLNVMSHDINLLRFLLPQAFAAKQLRVRAKQVQSALFEADGFDIEILCGRSDHGGWDQSLEIFFERGRMLLQLPSPLNRSAHARGRMLAPGMDQHIVPPHNSEWAFAAQLRDFLKARDGELALENSGHACLKDMELIENLWRNCEWKS